MPRPRKWRIVEFVPTELHFVPAGQPQCDLEEIILKVEEIEAVRLKDILGLNQDECAEKMNVSRQTFQRILSDARYKIARALIEGMALKVQGGNFTRNVCRVFCMNCHEKWEERYEDLPRTEDGRYQCPFCGAVDSICCTRRGGFCFRNCRNNRLNKMD